MIKKISLLLMLTLLFAMFSIAPTVSAHTCEGTDASASCGNCADGETHRHTDTNHYDPNGDTGCQSTANNELTICDVYWLVHDAITKGRFRQAAALLAEYGLTLDEIEMQC